MAITVVQFFVVILYLLFCFFYPPTSEVTRHKVPSEFLCRPCVPRDEGGTPSIRGCAYGTCIIRLGDDYREIIVT